MADVTISNLTSLTVTGNLLLPVSNGSTTGKVTVGNINSLAPVQSVASKTGVVTLTNADVGLGNVENKSSTTIRSEITSSNVTTALGYTPVSTGSSLIARAFVNFNGTTAGQNQTIRSQYNISNVTRVGTGWYRVAFTNPMPNSNYLVIGNCSAEYGAYWLNVVINSNNTGGEIAPTASQFDIATVHQTVGGGHDTKYVNLIVFST